MKKITLALLLFAPLSLWLGHDAHAGVPQADVAAGYGHTCRINSIQHSGLGGLIGPIECRGYNSYGQLGRGFADQTQHPTWVVPTGLAGLNFTAVATSSASTCAIQDNGLVWCWGYNGDGEMGDGTRTNRPLPQQVGLSANGIVAGAGHYCAVTHKTSSGARLYCWGWNNHGQIGDNTTTDALAPVEIFAEATNTLPLWSTYALAAGYDFTCGYSALQFNFNSRAVYCWGHNQRGQLGTGTTTDVHQPRGATALRPASNVAAVFNGVPGDPGVVAVNEIGATASSVCLHGSQQGTGEQLYCWGDNSHGQVTTNGATDTVPNPAPHYTGRAGVIGISTGNYGSQMCVTTNGAANPIYCWGGNVNYEAGGNPSNARAYSLVPDGQAEGTECGSGWCLQGYAHNPDLHTIATGAWHTLRSKVNGASLNTFGMGTDCYGEAGASGQVEGAAAVCRTPSQAGLWLNFWQWQF